MRPSQHKPHYVSSKFNSWYVIQSCALVLVCITTKWVGLQCVTRVLSYTYFQAIVQSVYQTGNPTRLEFISTVCDWNKLAHQSHSNPIILHRYKTAPKVNSTVVMHMLLCTRLHAYLKWSQQNWLYFTHGEYQYKTYAWQQWNFETFHCWYAYIDIVVYKVVCMLKVKPAKFY